MPRKETKGTKDTGAEHITAEGLVPKKLYVYPARWKAAKVEAARRGWTMIVFLDTALRNEIARGGIS